VPDAEVLQGAAADDFFFGGAKNPFGIGRMIINNNVGREDSGAQERLERASAHKKNYFVREVVELAKIPSQQCVVSGQPWFLSP